MKFEAESNLVSLFLDRAERYGDRTGLLYPSEMGYKPVSWREWRTYVEQITLGLYSLGARKGDRIAILSENRVEWTYADLGILGLGASVVPIYATSSADDIRYILENGKIEIVFISSPQQLEKIIPVLQSQSNDCVLRQVVCFDFLQREIQQAGILSLEELLARGRLFSLNNSDLYQQLVTEVASQDVATIIYTSGTTGAPKGVMLSHSNLIQNYLSAKEVIQVDESDIALSFLPLSHIFERLAGYYFMVFCGATIAYARSMQTVPEDILKVRPTVAAAVPRFYEKIYGRIMEKVETASPIQRKIFSWSVRIGREFSQKKMAQKKIPLTLLMKKMVAKLLVLKKIKKGLGGRIRFFISGGAPLAKELGEFFYAADVLILEGYGLTETSPVMTVNTVSAGPAFGTVGMPLSVAKVRIAEDGEILTSGPCVMLGYFQNDTATQEVIKDGWFHTGDIGEFDNRGNLKITDRKKDIIVTSGGKNIAPQKVENLILGDPVFSQVVVIGDRKNYLVALISLNRPEVERFAETNGIGGLSWEALIENPKVYGWVLGKMTERTKALASYEQIKYFRILPQELTLSAGELTPTLKVKRRVVMERYAILIEALYRKGEEAIKRTQIQ